MSDLRQQVREHYDAQSLSPEKVQALLAAGRISAPVDEKVVVFPEKKPWTRWLGAMAAALVFSIAGVWWMQRDVGDVSYAALPPRVIGFFAGKPDLVEAPQDKKELKAWLVSNGAPEEFEIPQGLLGLESAACQVVDVQGKKAYLSCYWREGAGNRSDTDLIHLLVARAEDFNDQPAAGKPVTREMDGWSFASWTKGDVIYTLAAAAPLAKVTPFISSNETTERMRFISSVTRSSRQQ